MQKIMAAAAAALFMSSANAAVIVYDVTRVTLGNQFTQGGGGFIPDVEAAEWSGRMFLDTEALVLSGTVSHRSDASFAQYIYTANWVIDFKVATGFGPERQLVVTGLECTFLGGNNACLDFSEGVQAGPAALFSGNPLDPTIGNTIVVKWNTLGPPFQSAFINTQLTVVPVPAAVWLFASALGLMAFLRRRVSIGR
ncbi:MAG: VPLPA-CTERM sorting domain-containing protein [Chromatiales bacterium]|nr:VPLPA-CTERM sorting domain-containing protein [Chromatiales bacterium]